MMRMQDVTNNDQNGVEEGSESTTIGADWTGSYVAALDFPATWNPVAYPTALNDREKWMSALPGAKNPFAPWGTRDPPVECTDDDCPADRCDDPDCECDGRFKWGHDGHYVTGDDIVYALPTSNAAYRVYIFTDDDPFIFIDMDDVRCPVTGAVHPAAIAFLAVLGPTWVEVSSSGTGLHAVYRGELPGSLKEPKRQLDDSPWGANDSDDLPVIELYDTKRKVGVLTGATVPGAPVEVNECDASALRSILEAHDELTADTARPPSEDVRVPDLNTGRDGDDAGSSGVTDDIEDVYDAIDRLDVQRVAGATIVSEWNDPSSAEHRSFLPTWGSSDDGGTANYVTDVCWTDSGNEGGWGGPVVMAAIDCNDLPFGGEGTTPNDVTGKDYVRAVDHLHDLGFDVPEYVPDGDSSALYMDVLGTYAPVDADPYGDPNDCLEACLRAREDGAVPVDADAPTLALHAVIDGVLGVSADSHAVDEGTRDLAQDVFDDLTVETARERGLIQPAGENGGDE